MSQGSFFKRHKLKIISLLFIALFFLLYFSKSMFVYVYPGQRGVLFKALSDKALVDKEYEEGLYCIAPWNKMFIFDTTQQKQSSNVQALTSSGLSVMLRVSAIFHPDPDKLEMLASHVGRDYVDKIIVPTLRSSVREVVGYYLPEALYTSAKSVIQQQILTEAQRELAEHPFFIEEIIIEEIVLPDAINEAIENKLKHQQNALAYTYILEQEEAEATRRSIEAESIKAYQAVVGSNLNDQILRWLEIRALADLSKSPNSKIVVMGNGGTDGSPLVLPMDLSPEQAKKQLKVNRTTGDDKEKTEKEN